MDGSLLMVSMLFGAIGLGMLMYGKKAGRLVPLIAGLGLMTIPYFISNLLILSIVCAALTALPWALRHL
jgi:hypothetical protein